MGSVIADMELTFDEKVGASEVQALLSEVTKDGKLGDLEVSQIDYIHTLHISANL